MPGHRACAGCGPAIAYRQILKAARGPTIATNATGCMEVVSTIYPYTSWKIPWIHTAFENVAANASGIEAALKVMGRKGRIKKDHIDVVAFAGDGGTYDIGIQALSGAVERGHDFLYVLYDNEAYMNTGIQRSGGTPHGAWTTTSPAGRVIPGKPEYKKPIADIILAHGIPYLATASPAYWRDLITKTRRGLEVDGPAFLHVLAPCPRGWRYDTSKTIEIAKLAVETCVFPLWEAIEGECTLSPPSKAIALKPERQKPIKDYLKTQGRFRHLFKPEFEQVIDEIQDIVNRRWKLLLEKAA
ncbi:MAG: pyruvate ferredoxin oxidoreductase [Candidatus Bathyarchaeota archaeon]|nr:MAG: pyruvate ferredoxin oxidoreductase [Candidatus Bathyarchaeota archaeon]